MHHFVVKNNGKTTKHGYGGHGEGTDLPVCPKPRRPGTNVPRDVVKTFKCTDAQSQANLDGRCDILNMIVTDKKTSEERDTLCYYTGSPPRRTANPVIHDAHFVNQVEVFSRLAFSKEVIK